MTEIETSSTRYQFDGRILWSTLKPGRRMSLEDAVENMEARNRLNLPDGIAILMDISALEDMSLDAITATVNAKDLSRYRAGALVVSTAVHQIIAREGRRFRKTAIPSKIFSNTTDAKRWLLAQLSVVH